MNVIVIMAGGSGERFWPLSRYTHPKQLLKLSGSGRSLLEEAVSRATAIVPSANVYIATSKHLQRAIQDANLGIPAKNVIAEPSRRNTVGCIIYATATILARTCRSPEEVTVGILTADHRIPDTEPFVQTVKTAMATAQEKDALVTIGIQPIFPSTGYGYIEAAQVLHEKETKPSLRVASFKEKPTTELAAKYIASGKYLWNSGMFFWRISTFQNEFGRVNPVMQQTLEDLTEALMNQDESRAERIFDELPNISIDYALMEKARHIRVVPGTFVWSDIGSWDALDQTYPKDANGNILIGDPIALECKNCIVYNATGQRDLAVGLIGLKDLIIVVKNDALLILPKDRAQDVRQIVSQLKRDDAKQLQ